MKNYKEFFNFEDAKNYDELLALIERYKKGDLTLNRIEFLIAHLNTLIRVLTTVKEYLINKEKILPGDLEPEKEYIEDIQFKNELLSFFGNTYVFDYEEKISKLSFELLVATRIRSELNSNL